MTPLKRIIKIIIDKIGCAVPGDDFEAFYIGKCLKMAVNNR